MDDLNVIARTDDGREFAWPVKLAVTANGNPVRDGQFDEAAGDRWEEVVPASQLAGAVSPAVIRSVIDELRALGQEWREEYPDGRVCKAELNRIADRLTGGQS